MPGFNRFSGVDSSDDKFQSAARSALAEPFTMTAPTNGATDVTRTPVIDIQEPIGAVWMHADLSADVPGMGLNSDVVINQSHSQSNSGISLDASTGIFTLQAGRVFKLEAQVYTRSYSLANGSAGYEWVYEDNSEIFGAVRAICRPATGTDQHSQQPKAAVILHTVEITKVKLRCVAASGTHELADLGTNVLITELLPRNLAAAIETVHATWSFNGGEIKSGNISRGYNLVRNTHFDGGPTAASWTKTNATITPSASVFRGWTIESTDGSGGWSLEPTVDADASQVNTAYLYCSIESDTNLSNIRLNLTNGTNSAVISTDYTAATDTLAVNSLASGFASPGIHTSTVVREVTKLAPGIFKIRMTGRFTSESMPLRVVINGPHIPNGSFTYRDLKVQDGSDIKGGTCNTGNESISSYRLPNSIWGDELLPSLTDCVVSVQGMDSSGSMCTPKKTVSFRTGTTS